jgi:cyanate permease
MLENEATISAIKETAKEITLLLGGTNLILVATITWLSKIWMDRILENERRKTQVIVEQLKNSLRKERS